MTGNQPDDRRQLEGLLRSLRDDVAFPPEPDVRDGVRKRLQDLSQFGAVSGASELIQGIETESQAILGSRSSTVGAGEGKSVRRQLLEMAAAVVVLVIFTGALVLLYRDLVSDEGAVPGTEDLTEEESTLEELITAIAFSRMVDGEAVLTFADVAGDVLHEVYGLPQHQWGAELYGVAAAVSPDGTRIAFEGSGAEHGNLYIKDLRDGYEEPLVVESESLDSSPVWSPDGEWIAFERNPDGHSEIYLVRPDGSDLTQLTETEDGAGLPVWSPDGERIAFLSPPSWEQLGYVPGSNPAEHTPFQIHIVNADGTDQREIPGGELAHPQDLVSTNDPNSAQSWSPDGQRLAVTVYEDHEDRDGAWSRLAIVDVDDESIEVFRPEMSIQSPSWSPDGRSIAVWGQSEQDAAGLYLFDVEDEEWASITVEDDSITGTEWSPDGRYIKMGRFHDEGLDVYVFDIETGEQHLVEESTNPASLNAWVRILAPDEPAPAGDREGDPVEAFLDEATELEDYDPPDPPYPIPEACDATELEGPFERKSLSGFWFIGDGLYAATESTAFYEGSNVFYWQTDAAQGDVASINAGGQRLDKESNAVPYVWYQPSPSQAMHRAFLALPEPGCWEIELSAENGERLEAVLYAFPAYEREIVAARNLSVGIGRVSEYADEFQQQYTVDLNLRHAEALEDDPVPVVDVADAVWIEDDGGNRYEPEEMALVNVSDGDWSVETRDVPTAPEDPLTLRMHFVLPPDADAPGLTIRLPDDHPDPGLPEVYRVSLDELIERTSDEPEPRPAPVRELTPTQDVTIELTEDETLAIAVQRWIDDRRVMSVFDLDGELLWEFDQVPNIEVEDFSPTIIADVSPDGQHLAFQHEDEGDATDIFVMDADSEGAQQLTTTGDNYRPVWSPDGESIAFLSDRAQGEETHEYQRAEVFIMERDGSNIRQLTDSPFGAGQMKWSHDGTMIAFASPGFHSAHLMSDGDPPEFPYQLYVVDVESGQQRELRDATMEHLAGFGLSDQPWISDNSGVLFERYGQVYLAWADGSGIEELSEFPPGEEGHQRWATASPDGKHVAFNWTQGEDGSPVGIVDLETGEATALIEELGTAWHSGWSPDGAYLAAMKAGEQPDDIPDDLVYRDLWVVSPDDGSARHIATGVTDHNVRWLIVPRTASSSN